MARKYVQVVEDDLTGELIDDGEGESITFSINGTSYAIDLTTANASEFHLALEKYVDAARSSKAASGRAARGSRRTGKGQLAVIREWAKENGHAVADRGRISHEVMDAYNSR